MYLWKRGEDELLNSSCWFKGHRGFCSVRYVLVEAGMQGHEEVSGSAKGENAVFGSFFLGLPLGGLRFCEGEEDRAFSWTKSEGVLVFW
mmetsp:Transcript_3111/g.4452  ORF Transcript_3111/g.4452 Transcript_3111/m.4452 type:complete len:89 (+) Transcript_3111:3-269(+)